MRRDAPMSEAIAALPRKGGYPVPYVADWTGESEDLFRFDSRLGHIAWFTGGKAGDGEPVFGKQNPMRQRECVMDMLCQVCHNKLSLPVWFIAGWVPRVPGTMVDLAPEEPVIEEPPLCTPCARYALLSCPGLNRDITGPYSGNLAYRTYEYDWALQVVQPTIGSPAVVHYVLAQLTKFETFTAKEFLEMTDARATERPEAKT